MKTKRLIFTVLMILGISMYYGCGKYEDGPSVSLRSKKARITNKWKLTEQIYDGKPSSSITNVMLDLKKDNTWIATTPSGSETGTWDFGSDKETLTLTPNGGSAAYTVTILRLTNKEFWMENNSGSSLYEAHFEADK